MNPNEANRRLSGGPAQHAGNQYHYLYAANRILEMLERDSDVAAVYLEGTSSVTEGEDAVDVCVERSSAIELVQVRWSGVPDRRQLQPAEWWSAVGGLWRAAAGLVARPLATLTVKTNRPPSGGLKEEWGVVESWRSLNQSDLATQLESGNPLQRRVSEHLRSVVGSTSIPSIMRLLMALRLEASLDDQAMEHERRELRLRLQVLHLDEDPWADVIAAKAAEYCLPGQAGMSINKDMVASWLNIESAILRYDVPRPDAYVPAPSCLNDLEKATEGLEPDGGVVVLVGPPGCGKTVQLSAWAEENGYPFYPCRLPYGRDDIVLRSAQEQFVRGLRALIADRYRDRAPVGRMRAPGTSEAALISELSSVLAALGAGSAGKDPAVLVIDGVDDAYRSRPETSFLGILQRPPRGVLFVISTQGIEFLPDWLRRPEPGIVHVSMPGLEESDMVTIADALLPPSDETAEKPYSAMPGTPSRADVIEKVCRLSARNPLVLRTLCERIRSATQEWRAILEALGDEPFQGVEAAFDHLFQQPAASQITWLRVLAATRTGLTISEISSASGVAVDDLAAELSHVQFVLEQEDVSGAPRYCLYHPALRRWVFAQPWVSEDVQLEIHSRLANMASTPDSHLAADKLYHLSHAKRWDDVLASADYSHFDSVMLVSPSPAVLFDEAEFMARAAAVSGNLGIAVRSALLRNKVLSRIEVLQDVEPAALCKVLISAGRLDSAVTLLEDGGDPSWRFGAALELAEWAFKEGQPTEAHRMWDLARRVGRIHQLPQDVPSFASALACRVWTGDELASVVDEVVSSVWRAGRPDEEPQVLADQEQLAARCDCLRRLGRAIRESGRQSEFPKVVGSVEAPYELALRLGLSEADPTDGENARIAVEPGLARHAWSDEARRGLASLALRVGALDRAVNLTGLDEPLPAPPSLLGSLGLGDEPAHDLFLWTLKSKLLAGISAEVAESVAAADEDRRRADAMYYAAAIALIAAEVSSEAGADRAEVVSRLTEARRKWRVERPWNMNWGTFFDARRALRDLAPRLLTLAFSLDKTVGEEAANELFELSGWSIGALSLESQVKVLGSLAALPEGRGWSLGRLPRVISEVRSSARETQERVSLLVGLADVARQLGLRQQALELAQEALRATKGLPYVKEEPRYYGLLELLEEMRSRGLDIRGHMRRVGRLIQQSHDATRRAYAGTWEWLVRIAAAAEPGLAFDLALSLEDDCDTAVPCARDCIVEIVQSSEAAISLPDWTALAWAAEIRKFDEAKALAATAMKRLEDVTEDLDVDRWRNWILGALTAGLQSREAAKVRSAFCSGVPLPSDDTGEPFSTDRYAALRRVVGDADVCDRAAAGEIDSTRHIVDRISEWLEQEPPDDLGAASPGTDQPDSGLRDRSTMRFHLEWALRDLLPAVSAAYPDNDLQKLEDVYHRLADRRPTAELDVHLARVYAARDPGKATQLASSAVIELWWWRHEEMVTGWKVLAETRASSVKSELITYVAERGIEPFWFIRTLRDLPHPLVSDEDIVGIFEAYCDDVEDSLSVLPQDPVGRSCLKDTQQLASQTTEGFLRDLLHRRDQTLRRRAREGLGILAHVRANDVAEMLADWSDLEAKPAYERLTGQVGRLSALWAVGELQPAAVAPFAQRVYERYVAPGGVCGNHFTLRELGRRVCVCGTRAQPTILPEDAVRILQQSPVPQHLTTRDEPWAAGKALFIVERDLEYDVERLAELFGLRARYVQGVVERYAGRLHRLTEEEVSRDRGLIDWAYQPLSRSLRSARTDLIEHALCIVQQRWYQRRLADERLLQDHTPAAFERRNFDPWLPALLVDQCRHISIYNTEHEASITDHTWVKRPIEDLPAYLAGQRDGWLVVSENLWIEVENRRVHSWVQSCLADEPLVERLLRGEPEKADVPERDLPSHTYLFETGSDFSWWWDRWTYGETAEEGSRFVAAYAERGLVPEEPLYCHVVRPLPVLSSSCGVQPATGGLEFKEDNGEGIWQVEWLPTGYWRAWARTDWLLRRLDDLGLCLFARRGIDRAVRDPTDSSLIRAPIAHGDVWSAAAMDALGRWSVC